MGRLARGDGGTLRFWDRQRPYEIAVFTAPNPFVAGPVDISVLVLDLASGEPVLDAKVRVKVEPLGRPAEALTHDATTEAATNKLFHAAVFELPESGVWTVEVTIEGKRAKCQGPIQVGSRRLPPTVDGSLAVGLLDSPGDLALRHTSEARLEENPFSKGLRCMNDLLSTSAYNSCSVDTSETDGARPGGCLIPGRAAVVKSAAAASSSLSSGGPVAVRSSTAT